MGRKGNYQVEVKQKRKVFDTPGSIRRTPKGYAVDETDYDKKIEENKILPNGFIQTNRIPNNENKEYFKNPDLLKEKDKEINKLKKENEELLNKVKELNLTIKLIKEKIKLLDNFLNNDNLICETYEPDISESNDKDIKEEKIDEDIEEDNEESFKRREFKKSFDKIVNILSNDTINENNFDDSLNEFLKDNKEEKIDEDIEEDEIDEDIEEDDEETIESINYRLVRIETFLNLIFKIFEDFA